MKHPVVEIKDHYGVTHIYSYTASKTYHWMAIVPVFTPPKYFKTRLASRRYAREFRDGSSYILGEIYL
jgi:hypothetical protein